MRDAPASLLVPPPGEAEHQAAAPEAAPAMRAAIVDRDALGRERLRRLLEQHGAVVATEADGGSLELALVAHEHPDVLFVDLDAPDLDTAALRQRLDAAAPLVVGVAEGDGRAMAAYELGAVDCLVEPVTPQRLGVTLERVRQRLRERGALARQERLRQALGAVAGALGVPRAGEADDDLVGEGAAAGGHELERILVKDAERMYFVRVEDVDWVEAHGNYVRLHAGQQVHVLRLTMNALERRLPGSRFARIHRSTIVNLDRVREMQPWFSGDYVVHLHGGARLKLSRVYRDRLEARLRG